MVEARLPARPFLYTEDQVADILSLHIGTMRGKYAYYEGRTESRKQLDDIIFLNIAKDDQAPEWRCSERELLRWMKRKGFRVYDRTWA